MMNGIVLGVAMLVSSTGVSPAVDTSRPTVAPAAFTFDLPDEVAMSRNMGPASRSTTIFQTSQPRDSLKNGAIIGAIIGAATGAVIAAVGCAIIEELEHETPGDDSCVGPAVYLVASGTVIGAAIGVGVDALFERGPSAALPAGGRRTVLRLRFEF
jgi:hypothetical protein